MWLLDGEADGEEAASGAGAADDWDAPPPEEEESAEVAAAAAAAAAAASPAAAPPAPLPADKLLSLPEGEELPGGVGELAPPGWAACCVCCALYLPAALWVLSPALGGRPMLETLLPP